MTHVRQRLKATLARALGGQAHTACICLLRPLVSCTKSGKLVSLSSGLQGLLPEKKIFEVHIEKGHKHNQKVVLRGEAGYSEPGIQPGDVIFVLEQKPHKTFKRIQADLVIEKVRLDGC